MEGDTGHRVFQTDFGRWRNSKPTSHCYYGNLFALQNLTLVKAIRRGIDVRRPVTRLT